MSEEVSLPKSKKSTVEDIKPVETVVVSVPVKDANGMVQRFEEKEVPLSDAAYTNIPGGLGGQRKY